MPDRYEGISRPGFFESEDRYELCLAREEAEARSTETRDLRRQAEEARRRAKGLNARVAHLEARLTEVTNAVVALTTLQTQLEPATDQVVALTRAVVRRELEALLAPGGTSDRRFLADLAGLPGQDLWLPSALGGLAALLENAPEEAELRLGAAREVEPAGTACFVVLGLTATGRIEQAGERLPDVLAALGADAPVPASLRETWRLAAAGMWGGEGRAALERRLGEVVTQARQRAAAQTVADDLLGVDSHMAVDEAAVRASLPPTPISTADAAPVALAAARLAALRAWHEAAVQSVETEELTPHQVRAEARRVLFALVDTGSIEEEARRDRFSRLQRVILAASEHPSEGTKQAGPSAKAVKTEPPGGPSAFSGFHAIASVHESPAEAVPPPPARPAVQTPETGPLPVPALLGADLFASEPGEQACRGVALRAAGPMIAEAAERLRAEACRPIRDTVTIDLGRACRVTVRPDSQAGIDALLGDYDAAVDRGYAVKPGMFNRRKAMENAETAQTEKEVARTKVRRAAKELHALATACEAVRSRATTDYAALIDSLGRSAETL